MAFFDTGGGGFSGSSSADARSILEQQIRSPTTIRIGGGFDTGQVAIMALAAVAIFYFVKR
ncbi:MAG: hypothetical protein AAF221_08375 [Pseudomonadota bacterium]